MKQFKVLQKEEVFAGLAFQVSRQRVSFPNGHIADIDFLALRKTVVMVPLSGAGSIYFVEQYRHAAGQVLLELPAGTTENNEPPAICAQRELREEIGMSAGDIKPIGEFFVAPGY
ncbi:MAG: NUDIX hydrolase, partial [Anaerolineae bacterium]|nr:NUDIX hydrolase [Anaerolineae bacterium]